MKYLITYYLLILIFFQQAMAQSRTYLYTSASDTTQGYYLSFTNAAKATKAILICPGGGYGHVAMNHEGVQMAQWLNTLGFDAYVLHYRVSSEREKFYYPSQLNDVTAAMHQLSEKYKTVGLLGWSAGGHLAGTYVTAAINKADFGILLYPVISTDTGYWHKGSFQNLLGPAFSKLLPDSFSVDKRITKKTPPLWLMHCKDDKAVPYQNSVLAFEASKPYQTKTELHLFETGGHGFGMRPVNAATDEWKTLLANWLQQF
jgi:acetyl esterase/lipase